MTLDTLDAAFVQRWRAAVPAARPAPREPAPPEPARVPGPPPPRPPAPAALAPAPSASTPPAAAVPPPARLPVRSAADRTLLDRLLAEAAPQWHAIADRIEAARSRGRRVIAVAGCDRGEGRTTLVTAVAEVLQSRGRDVVVIEAADLAGLAGPPHDKRIVLVDAGVWFPAGPIRRSRLVVASHGCEAAIVVRRACRPAAAAIEAALEAIGVEPLGEVVTFVGDAAAGPTEATA
jgi:hypothetical protein